ncbi:hypothetical protein ACSBR2_027673 [Camellia fascicularis]
MPSPCKTLFWETDLASKSWVCKAVGIQKSETFETHVQTKSSCHVVGSEPPSDLRRVNRNRPASTDSLYSDATSSDWSIFTSSDDASFTTESTRDSFSTVDYADACNADPFTSIFNTIYRPEYSSSRRTISCNMFSSGKSETRFASEGKGFVLDSYFSTQPPDRIHRNSSHCIL